MFNILDRRIDKFILLTVDLFIIFFTYVLAFFLRYENITARNWESFLALAPWILLISLFFLTVYELYTLNRKSIWDVVRSIFVATTFITFLTMAASFIFREFALPRSVILISYFLMIGLLSGWKFIYSKCKRDYKSGTTLLIGSQIEFAKIGMSFLGPIKWKHIQPDQSIEEIITQMNKVDSVIITPELLEEKKAQIIYQAMKQNKILYVVPSLYDLLLSKSIITSLDDTMVLAVKPFGLPADQRLIKRVFDMIFSFLFLVLLSPIFLFVSLLIKFEEPKGRIIFKQKRIGQHGNEFQIYKFRSMIEDAEVHTGPIIAKQNDSRITRVGRLLRLTRIDELPQLFNVLIGDMSIVGPRPEREYFTKQFVEQFESYEYRHVVKPGITGYAQVMGKYTTDVEDKLRYDLHYIRNYSLLLDIIIMLRTIIVLLDKTKAEGREKPAKVKKGDRKFPVNY